MFERDKQERGGNISAFLGPGCRVTGKLEFDGPVIIEGQLEGEIIARDMLTIGETAVVTAQITGTSIIINGCVTGDVTARKRLEIRARAKLSGSISTASLVINEGATFEGQCTMSGVESRPASKDNDLNAALFLNEDDAVEGPAIQDRHVELST